MNIKLPDIYGITATILFTGVDEFIDKLNDILARSKLKLLQVREKQMNKVDFEKFAQTCVKICHQHDCKVLLNADLDTVRKVNADGIHLTSSNLQDPKLDYSNLIVGASCHNSEDLNLCFTKHQANFAVLSPVNKTNSHINAPVLGWNKFTQLCSNYQQPIFALGGLKLDDINLAKNHGAVGIASMRDIWELPNNY